MPSVITLTAFAPNKTAAELLLSGNPTIRFFMQNQAHVFTLTP